MRESREQDMLQGFHLCVEGRVDVRVAVPEQVDPPGADGVEVAPAVEVLQPDALSATHWYERQPFMILHLCAGMPYGGEIALDEIDVRHGGHHIKQDYLFLLIQRAAKMRSVQRNI